MMLRRALTAALGAIVVLLPATPARARQTSAARDDGRVALSHAEYDGSHTRLQINADRRITREVRDAGGAEPVTLSIARHPVTGAATSVTVECTVRGRRLTQTASIAGQNEIRARDQLVDDVCYSDKRH